MTSRQIDEWALHAYVDNELSATQRAEVEALLRREPELAEKVQAWRQQRQALKGAFDGVLAEPVPSAIRSSLGRPGIASHPLLAMVAAVLLLLLGGSAGWMMRTATFPSTPVASADGLGARALAAHAVFAVEVRHPVEVRAEEKDHLEAWLSKRVGNPVRPPDLSAEGYALLGGRLLASSDRPLALLMYENAQGQRISIVVATSDTDATTALALEERGKLIACTWQDGKLAIAITGELARDPMMKLARAVYEKLEG